MMEAVQPQSGRATAQGARGDAQALLAVVRCGRDRGVAALSVVDRTGDSGGEHFIPFGLRETPSEQGRDFVYAGLAAALDRLRSLGIRRVLVQTDDEQLVAELAKKAEPHRDLTLLYIMVGCKLNEFASAKVVAVPPSRIEHLREKAESLARTLGSARKPRRRPVELPLAV